MHSTIRSVVFILLFVLIGVLDIPSCRRCNFHHYYFDRTTVEQQQLGTQEAASTSTPTLVVVVTAFVVPPVIYTRREKLLRIHSNRRPSSTRCISTSRNQQIAQREPNATIDTIQVVDVSSVESNDWDMTRIKQYYMTLPFYTMMYGNTNNNHDNIDSNSDAATTAAVTSSSCYGSIPASTTTNLNRRSFFRHSSLIMGAVVIAAVSTTSTITMMTPEIVNAKIIDATDIFADNDWSSSSSSTASSTSTPQGSTTTSSKQSERYTATDEITVRINRTTLQEQYHGRLGLELVDIEFRTNLRVRVKSVQANSYAASQKIQPNWIIVSINDVSMERTNSAGVRQYLVEAIQQPQSSRRRNDDDIVVAFRDPSLFQSQLRDMSSSTTTTGGSGGEQLPTVTTQVGPSGDTTQRNTDGTIQNGRSITTAITDQRITVQQLRAAAANVCTRKADTDDLLEISYTGTVVETGQMFDGSAILMDDTNRGIPGRGNDISIFFVLGKQPFGQFPPGWDVGLYGMCVNERRRLILPPALAYGNKGLARRNIPPNATLQYDITLISINGLATP